MVSPCIWTVLVGTARKVVQYVHLEFIYPRENEGDGRRCKGSQCWLWHVLSFCASVLVLFSLFDVLAEAHF